MPRKHRLTLDEHLEMGRVLAGIRDELAHRAVQLDKAYPSNGPEGVPHKVGAALRTLDETRGALEILLSRERTVSPVELRGAWVTTAAKTRQEAPRGDCAARRDRGFVRASNNFRDAGAERQ
ncbi:hypothetical protein ABZ883_39800 [Streptomyces sp. NPDC046977]|uniref:hypothetical protein n=1 Tax=Streptomyces sp. NPDC046977 TaxID=3154703 RepID=UPI0033F37575